MLKAKERIRLHCYTDGGCNKKGEGAAATMLLKNADILTVSKIVQTSTTNNKMELSAAIAGLVLFKEFCEEYKVQIQFNFIYRFRVCPKGYYWMDP